MIKEASNCLEDQEFHTLLSAKAPAETLEDWWDHLSNCDPCSTRLQSVEEQGHATPDTIRQLVGANANSVLNIQNELECQAVVQQMMADPDLRQSYDEPVQQIGAYRILRSLGEGGMGTVYLAEHQRLKKLVAIKLLPREKSSDDAWLQRFDREMQAVASLENDHIVKASDAGDHDSWHFLVMEYLDGVDLAKLSHGFGAISIGAACEIIRQVAIGLSAIHEVGLVHRDIKPSNVFLTRSGIAKVLDLGLVLRDDESLLKDERLTTVGNFLGTLTYMPPEQIEDSRSVDHRSDIYALGATLYRLLSGKSLFQGIKQMAPIVRAISVGDYEPIQQVRTSIPDRLASLIERMLHVDPSLRPQSALEVAEELTEFAEPGELSDLIVEASSRSDRSDSNHSLLPKASHHSTSTNTPSSGRRWLLLALLPFAIAAGVLLTIVTDRGTLVIESSDPDLKIQVTQNEQVIDEFEMKSGKNSIVLYSGKYEIALSDVDASEFRLSESRVLLTRNGTEVVRIERKPVSEHRSSSDASSQLADNSSSRPKNRVGAVYQGKSIADWIEVVKTERDGTALVDAIKAIQLLCTPETEQEAATAVLTPLEVFGSSFVTSDDLALLELSNRFSNFTPESRIAALTQALQSPSIRPGLALVFLTSLYKSPNEPNNLELACIGKTENRELVSGYQQALASWIERVSKAGPRQFRSRRDERLVDSSIANAQEIRLKLLLAQPGLFELAKDSRLKDYVLTNARKSLSAWKQLKASANGDSPTQNVYGGGMGGMGAGGAMGGMGLGGMDGGYGEGGIGGMGGGGMNVGFGGGGMGGMYSQPVQLSVVNACSKLEVDSEILECCLDGLFWHNGAWNHALDKQRFSSLLANYKKLLGSDYQESETLALLVRLGISAKFNSQPPVYKLHSVSRKILNARIANTDQRLESVQLLALLLNSSSAMDFFEKEELLKQAMTHLLAIHRDRSAQDWERHYALDALVRFVVNKPAKQPGKSMVDGEIVYTRMASMEIRLFLLQSFNSWAPLLVKLLQEEELAIEAQSKRASQLGSGSGGVSDAGYGGLGGAYEDEDMYGAGGGMGAGGMGGLGGGGMDGGYSDWKTWPMGYDGEQPTVERNPNASTTRDTIYSLFQQYQPAEFQLNESTSRPCRQIIGDFIETRLKNKDQRWIDFVKKNPEWKPN